MDIEELFNRFYYSPSYFADKKIMRSLIPAVSQGITGRTVANIGAAAGIGKSLIGKRSARDVTGMQESGATHRTNLKNAADTLIRKLMESGATRRTKLKNKNLLDLEHQGYLSDISKIGETGRVQEGILGRFGSNIGGGDYRYDQQAIHNLIKDKIVSDRLVPAHKTPTEEEDESYYEMYSPAP